jgi:predicted acylesterase/phospholipase RssA
MASIDKKMDIPEKERALVLQGGGSLGAYEAIKYNLLGFDLSISIILT